MVDTNRRNLLIIDDLDFLADLAGGSFSIALEFIQNCRQRLSPNSFLLLQACGDCEELRAFVPYFSLHLHLRPIGCGFGRHITGEVLYLF